MPYRKLYFVAALSVLLVLGFIASSVISYYVAHDSLSSQLADETLPLTSDNIYSEIEQDLLRSILISSLMAHDTFVRDWALTGEEDSEQIIRYLDEIKSEHDTTTSFFVSDRTRRYYHPDGILKTVSRDDPGDAWYFRVRDMNEPYEVNVDTDTADPNRLSIFVNYRVTDYEGNYIGATGVGLAVDSVAELIESYQQRYGRQIFFIDRDGAVTLRGDHFEGREHIRDRRGLQEVATKILSNPSVSTHYAGADGRTVYVNSRFIPELDWYLVVEQAGSRAETRILSTLMLNIGVALGITALVLVTGFFTVRGYQLRLEEMATTDKLTGGANRQVFDMLFDQAAKTSMRYGTPVSLVTIDIDNFKSVNDTYGHVAGDAVLRALSAIIREHIRESDVLCRWGGDELVLLLNDCTAADARTVAEKIRDGVRTRTVRHAGNDIAITVSIGVVEYRNGEDVGSVIARCDQVLYQSKRGGRDAVSDG